MINYDSMSGIIPLISLITTNIVQFISPHRQRASLRNHRAVGVQGAFATSAWALFGVLCEDATWLDPGFPGLVPTHGSSEWCENAAGDLIKRMMTGPG